MPTVFIAQMAIILPTKFTEGDTIDETAAGVLNQIHLGRIRSRLRYLLGRGEISEDELQRKAHELALAPLAVYSTDDDDAEDDPVVQEAMVMARTLITSRMAQEGLPPPKNLDIHAKALVDAMPDLQEQARKRVEARYQAAAQAIGGMNVTAD